MRRTIKTAMILAGFVASMGAIAYAAPVGMACHVEGKPDWKSDDGWKPLHILQRLNSGDAVRCGPGESAVVVLFSTGARYSVGANATGTLAEKLVSGAKMLGAPGGPSAAIAQRLGGARSGAVMARPAAAYTRLHFQDTSILPVPKTPPSHDWLRTDERSWQMNTIPNATSYVFSLINPDDYVVFSKTFIPGADLKAVNGVTGFTVTMPDEVVLKPRTPYVWRLHGLTANGNLTYSYWGTTTVLTPEDAAQLSREEKSLLTAEGKLPADPVQLALLAALYRNYGVLENALEIIDDKMADEPGKQETRTEIIAQSGKYATMLDEQGHQAL